MNDFLSKARVDLEESLRRDPKLIAAYHGLLEIARLNGDQKWAASLSRIALALDPADQWIYEQWIDAEQPRWGGSFEKMDAIAQEGVQHSVDNPLLKRLSMRVACEHAREFTCKDCGGANDRQHRTSALALYRDTAQTMPTTCFLESAGRLAEEIEDYSSAAVYDAQAFRFLDSKQYALRRSVALQQLGKSDWAQEVIDDVAKKHPDDLETLRLQGWLFESQHRWKEAEQPYLKVFDRRATDRKASMELVRIYANELNDLGKAREILARFAKEQPENPRVWLLQAAIDREVDDKLCKADLERYLASVDEKAADEEERTDIELARKHLAEVKQHLGETTQ
jgi:tetratricopeptide (TPR) repeat protein